MLIVHANRRSIWKLLGALLIFPAADVAYAFYCERARVRYNNIRRAFNVGSVPALPEESDAVDVRVEKRMTQCFVDSSHWYIFSDVAY